MAAGLTRRDFLVGAAGAGSLVLLGGAGSAFADGESQLVRPPGGQDYERLLRLCMRCDRCRGACPQGCIDVSHIEDGLLQARLPKMNFSLGLCDFCDGSPQCIRVCPSGALASAFESSTDRIGIACVRHDACLLDRLSGGCSKECIRACEYGALSLSEGGSLVVDEVKCNGCGACEFVCPAASYASYAGGRSRGIEVVSPALAEG